MSQPFIVSSHPPRTWVTWPVPHTLLVSHGRSLADSSVCLSSMSVSLHLLTVAGRPSQVLLHFDKLWSSQVVLLLLFLLFLQLQHKTQAWQRHPAQDNSRYWTDVTFSRRHMVLCPSWTMMHIPLPLIATDEQCVSFCVCVCVRVTSSSFLCLLRSSTSRGETLRWASSSSFLCLINWSLLLDSRTLCSSGFISILTPSLKHTHSLVSLWSTDCQRIRKSWLVSPLSWMCQSHPDQLTSIWLCVCFSSIWTNYLQAVSLQLRHRTSDCVELKTLPVTLAVQSWLAVPQQLASLQKDGVDEGHKLDMLLKHSLSDWSTSSCQSKQPWERMSWHRANMLPHVVVTAQGRRPSQTYLTFCSCS